jgi:hypothetical protein
MKIRIKKELQPFVELIFAVSISFIIGLGLIYGTFKPLYDLRRKPLGENLGHAFKWYFRILSQLLVSVGYLLERFGDFFIMIFRFRFWGAIKFIVHEIARTLDLIGNVAAGEMIEDIITYKEKTFFGIGDITISAAIGYLVDCYKNGDLKALNKTGLWLSRSLNKSFNEEEHSWWSFQREIEEHPIYGTPFFLNDWHELT